MKILLVAVNAKYIHSNLAVYSLRAYASEYKDMIKIKSYTINQYVEDILADIYRERADVIAFSCYLWNITMVEELAGLLHQLRPDLPIWFGGPEVSYDGGDCLRRNPGVTGVMRGEGEAIFREVAAHYVDDSVDLADIRGIIYRENGRLVDNGWREPMDMNELPFAYGDMTDFENRIVYYETSRGCPFSCSYCLSSIDKRVRLRDMALVERELQFFIDHEVPQVKFVDRTFNCNKAHAMAIWRYIRDHDRGITNFHFEIGADLLDDEELALLQTLRPGLVQLEIGVQSTYDTTIRAVCRTMKLDRLTAAVERVRAGRNIHQHLDLIAGLPFEDYDRFKQSFNEVFAMKPDQLQLGFLKVLKGSAMHERASEYGIIYRQKPPYEVLQTRWLSYEALLRLKGVEEMVEIYYNSHQYDLTLQYLMYGFDTPFSFFETLADFYEAKGYGTVAHSRLRRYDILLEFAKMLEDGGKTAEEAGNAGEDDRDAGKVEWDAGETDFLAILKGTMLYDLYARENLKSRPQWAPHSGVPVDFSERFYRQEGLVKQYLPSYGGHTARQIQRMTHMERFPVDIRATAGAGMPCGGPEILLFDYMERDALNHGARITAVHGE